MVEGRKKSGKTGSRRSRSKWAGVLNKFLVHHPDVAWQVIDDETVIVVPGPEPVMHVLNETGTFIWKSAEQGTKTVQDLVQTVLEEYDVGPIRARRDVCELAMELEKAGLALLREEPGQVPPLWE